MASAAQSPLPGRCVLVGRAEPRRAGRRSGPTVPEQHPVSAFHFLRASRELSQTSDMAIFFTSDTHFGHGGALGLYRRPFLSVATMNEAIVERWNETVGPHDDVWHLGDFAIRQPAAAVADLLGRLNGQKHLVAGNND